MGEVRWKVGKEFRVQGSGFRFQRAGFSEP